MPKNKFLYYSSKSLRNLYKNRTVTIIVKDFCKNDPRFANVVALKLMYVLSVAIRNMITASKSLITLCRTALEKLGTERTTYSELHNCFNYNIILANILTFFTTSVKGKVIL